MFNFGGSMRMYFDPETGRIWAQNTSPPHGWAYLTEVQSHWEARVPSPDATACVQDDQTPHAASFSPPPSLTRQQEGADHMAKSHRASPALLHGTPSCTSTAELSALYSRLADAEHSIMLLQSYWKELCDEISSLWTMRPRSSAKIPFSSQFGTWDQ